MPAESFLRTQSTFRQSLQIVKDKASARFGAKDLFLSPVNLNMFSFLWSGVKVDQDFEPGIGDLMDEEFQLHRYHQRLIDGKANFGWQRNLIYFLHNKPSVPISPTECPRYLLVLRNSLVPASTTRVGMD